MSRIGKQPIEIPQGVEVKIEGNVITVKGPKGELSRSVHVAARVEQQESMLMVSCDNPAMWGTTRTVIANMILGVTQAYEKKLQLEGVGYRAAVEAEHLTLQVGFSHPVEIKTPEGIEFGVENNMISVKGIDKEQVGQAAARIRKVRPAEPYKGKGFRYEGEIIRRKLGKRAVGAGK
jgi:large subunit ribosomal protein L6